MPFIAKTDPLAVPTDAHVRIEERPYYLGVTSRKVIWLFSEQFRLDFVPVLHRLQGCFAAQG